MVPKIENWDDPNNWTPSGRPTSSDCITIPATPNDPIILASLDAVGYNLEIETGATLTQRSNSSLTIEDSIIIEPNGDLEVKRQSKCYTNNRCSYK